MKKAIIIFSLAMIAPFVINAQGLGLGIKAGANFANQDIKDLNSSTINSSTITNFHGGVYLNLNLSEKFGITPEFLFSGNGSSWNNAKVNTNYLSIPVMLRWKPISLISLQAGPQFSFLTKAKREDLGDITDQLKNNDFGLAIGAGVHLPLGINGGVRYVWGFTNIAEASSLGIDEAKNKTFQIYVGWTMFGQN